MQKRGVTILLTILLTVCLLGMEKMKSGGNEEIIHADAGVEKGAEREAGEGTEERAERETEKSITKGAEKGQKGAEYDDEKLVALTFDDGPNAVYTKKLLDGLRERNVKATFFLIGKSIEGKEDIVKQMAEDGHLIGSHTFNHVQLTQLTIEEACAEITCTNDAIYNVTGVEVKYIRPPYGSWDANLECAINMREVGWTVDPRDWDVRNTQTIVERVLNHVEDGSIILLHDVYDTSVDAAFQIIDTLKEQGYTFVTVDRLILD